MEPDELRKTLPKTAAAVERLMADPAARFKLKLTVDAFLKMDPNDALADAGKLVEICAIAVCETYEREALERLAAARRGE